LLNSEVGEFGESVVAGWRELGVLETTQQEYVAEARLQVGEHEIDLQRRRSLLRGLSVTGDLLVAASPKLANILSSRIALSPFLAEANCSAVKPWTPRRSVPFKLGPGQVHPIKAGFYQFGAAKIGVCEVRAGQNRPPSSQPLSGRHLPDWPLGNRLW